MTNSTEPTHRLDTQRGNNTKGNREAKNKKRRVNQITNKNKYVVAGNAADSSSRSSSSESNKNPPVRNDDPCHPPSTLLFTSFHPYRACFPPSLTVTSIRSSLGPQSSFQSLLNNDSHSPTTDTAIAGHDIWASWCLYKECREA